MGTYTPKLNHNKNESPCRNVVKKNKLTIIVLNITKGLRNYKYRVVVVTIFINNRFKLYLTQGCMQQRTMYYIGTYYYYESFNFT